MSFKFRLQIATALIFCVLGPAAHAVTPSSSLNGYALFADELIRARGLDIPAGDVGVNQGSLLVSGTFDGATSVVAADTVQVSKRSKCAGIAANTVLETGAGCPLSMPFSGPLFPNLAAACGFPQPAPMCDPSQRVSVGHDETISLPPGVYGDLMVAGGGAGPGHVQFAGGNYVFCSVRAARKAQLEFDSASSVFVIGDVVLGNGSDTGPSGAGLSAADLQLFVGGDRMKVSRKAQLHAHVCAPTTELRLTMGSKVEGRFAAREIRADRITARNVPGAPPTTTTTTTSSTSTSSSSSTTSTSAPPTTTSSSTTTSTSSPSTSTSTSSTVPSSSTTTSIAVSTTTTTTSTTVASSTTVTSTSTTSTTAPTTSTTVATTTTSTTTAPTTSTTVATTTTTLATTTTSTTIPTTTTTTTVATTTTTTSLPVTTTTTSTTTTSSTTTTTSSTTTTTTGPAVCGNGVTEGAEECDDANDDNNDDCVAGCHDARCGDGFFWSGVEECDDGNTMNGDGCSSTCVIEPPVCGNDRIEGDETCDDGNTVDGDSCPSNCRIAFCTPSALSQLTTVTYTKPAEVTVGSLVVFVNYPDGTVSIPGNGNQASVRGTITNLPTGFVHTANDLDYGIREVLSPQAPGNVLPAGTIFKVNYTRCQGSPAPTAGQFTCTVEDAGTPGGLKLPLTGFSCTVTVP